MRRDFLPDHHEDFAVLAGTARSQAAIMILPPGGSTGERGGTEHPQADQWLYVISGEGEALGADQRIALSPGALLLIAAGEGHEIRNTGDQPLRTLNVYAPPAYDEDGEPLSAT
jgi:uncharacterized cupin superfamily protein